MTRDTTHSTAAQTNAGFSAGPIVRLLTAGVVATVVFDLIGQWLSPALGFAALAPQPLASQVIEVFTGVESAGGALALHWFTGIVVYPFAYALIARPIANAIAPATPWPHVAIAYGVVLWVFALYVMAHLVAGKPPFLGFTGITWVALVAHVVFALIVAAALRIRRQ